MKIIGVAFALTLMASISACSGAIDDIDEDQQALGSSYVETTYYASEAHIRAVGSCVSPSICTDTSTRCEGRITRFYERELIPCGPP
jgi:hypothetical protein